MKKTLLAAMLAIQYGVSARADGTNNTALMGGITASYFSDAAMNDMTGKFGIRFWF